MEFKVERTSLAYQLSREIYRVVAAVVGKRAVKPEAVILEHPAQPEHGDYSTNIALRVKSKKYPLPLDLAHEIVNRWRSRGLPESLGKIEVASPGFINLWLKTEVLVSQLERVLEEKDEYGMSSVGQGKTVVIDYSSPNIAKPFGIGHLRSTIIGQALYNLYRFLGFKTIGDNHLGDWGTQFGKIIVAVKKWNQGKIQNLSIEKLEKLYVKFHREADKNEKLIDEARVWFKKLEEKDPEARKIWRACVEVSMKEFNRIYDLLGVKIDYAYGESFYEDKMPAVIERAKKLGIAVESEGALVIKFPELGLPPAMLLKSDGATTYETRDLACIAYRKKRWQPDLYLYEVGAEQKLHFQQTFAAAVKLGYGRPEQFVHVAHGLIRLPEGKMSTRKGKTIHLEAVLHEAIDRARKIIENSETSRGLKKREQAAVARAVGVGAVKYFDLLHHPTTSYVFDWQKAFVLEGNSAPYLQYTYARCRSVWQRGEIANLQLSVSGLEFNDEELALLRTIYRFPEVVVEAGKNFAPNLICNFLFDLGQKYNLFYHRHPILKAESKERVHFRLALTLAVGQVIKNGLGLLGIETPERM